MREEPFNPMSPVDPFPPGAAPAQILGVSPEDGPERIRAAYLDMLRRHSPERDPVAFERIRDAYELLNDPRRRVRTMLKVDHPYEPFASLVEKVGARRVMVGLRTWLDAIKALEGKS